MTNNKIIYYFLPTDGVQENLLPWLRLRDSCLCVLSRWLRNRLLLVLFMFMLLLVFMFLLVLVLFMFLLLLVLFMFLLLKYLLVLVMLMFFLILPIPPTPQSFQLLSSPPQLLPAPILPNPSNSPPPPQLLPAPTLPNPSNSHLFKPPTPPTSSIPSHSPHTPLPPPSHPPPTPLPPPSPQDTGM